MDSSAITVASNEDLLTEILLRLPAKPLFRFKCVSKQWRSLINGPHFYRRKNPNNRVAGLVVLRQDKSHDTQFVYDVIPLYQSLNISHAFISRSVQFVDQKRTEILDSCNGLLCFRFDENFEEKYDYYVCNPMTRQIRKLPRPNHTILPEVEDASVNADLVNLPTDPDSESEELNPSAVAIQLAFDPRKSSNFKVVCLYFAQNDVLEMEIYSSETGLWRRQMCEDLLTLEFISPETGRWMCIRRPLFPKSTLNIKKGIYWNGAMNWLNFSKGDGLYFNFDEERFGKWPILPLCNGPKQHKINYFGGSHDHMFMAVFHDPNATNFDLYEMDMEYSGWYIRYHVDVDVVMKSSIYPMWLGDCGFDIISVVLGNNEENSFVVIGIPGMAIRYNLGDKSFKKIWNFFTRKRGGDGGEVDVYYCRPMYVWFDVFNFIPSISSI